MVGLPTNSSDNPVTFAHRAIHAADGDVSKVLSALTPPPPESIPNVDDHSAKPGHWVRYTAMIQDIWDTEMFVASSPDGKSGLLVENAAASDHPSAKLAERLPVYLVSLPGETEWARLEKGKSGSGLAHSSVASEQNLGPGGLKRSRDEQNEPTRDDNEMDTTPANQSGVSVSAVPMPSSPSDKRPRPTQIEPAGPQERLLGLNTPVHNQPGASAVVAKLYDMAIGRELKINSVVEVVGILQDALDFSPAQDNEQPDAFAAEFAARNPSNVKRLHAVGWREVQSWELNPLTKRLGASGVKAVRQEVIQVAGGMREVLVRYIASALCGDVLSAEYLVMALLSRPVRSVGGSVLGKLSLNIVLPSGADASVAVGIVRALEKVCSAVVEVNVSIGALNSMELFPKKDYGVNRLKAGALQLPVGSCLIGNESQLSNGRLEERGVKNVRALTSVSLRGLCPIDFQYYEAEVGVECCSIFLSKGGKSIIPTDVVVRVREDESSQFQGWDTYDADLLRKMRLAVVVLAEDGTFDISDAASVEVEKEFVEARKRGEAKDGQESLQTWLRVARACSRSFGEKELSVERWRYALNMERRRQERVKR